MNPAQNLNEEQVRSALHQAVDVAGGIVKLADRLSVPAVELEKWIAGAALPPVHAVLGVLKVLSEQAVTVADRQINRPAR
jgi:hypothetical protein